MKPAGILEITTAIGYPVACRTCPQGRLVSRYRDTSTTTPAGAEIGSCGALRPANSAWRHS